MKLQLLKGVEEDQKQELRQNFIQAQQFRKRLVEVLNKDIEALQAGMRDEDLFSSPNWPFMQADKVAQTKAIKRVIGLLEEKTLK